MRHLLIVPALLLAACGASSSANGGEADGDVVAPQGTGSQRSYAATGFQRIGLSGPDSAIVQIGPAFSVRAEGDPEVLDRLEVKLKGDRLSIGRKRDWTGTSRGSARFIITAPRLTGVGVAGSGDMRIDRVQVETFKASVAGSGNLAIGAVQAQLLDASVAGSGDLTTGGAAERLEVSIAGSGNVEAPGLVARSAKVSIAGSGRVLARVNGDAKVSIAGSGAVDLGPQARCNVSKVGSGGVHCGG